MTSTKSSIGFVYFVYEKKGRDIRNFFSDEKLPIKIGSTSNLKKRIGTMATGNSSLLVVVSSIKTTDGSHKRLEKQIQDSLNKDRIKGEWFNITQKTIDKIKEHFCNGKNILDNDAYNKQVDSEIKSIKSDISQKKQDILDAFNFYESHNGSFYDEANSSLFISHSVMFRSLVHEITCVSKTKTAVSKLNKVLKIKSTNEKSIKKNKKTLGDSVKKISGELQVLYLSLKEKEKQSCKEKKKKPKQGTLTERMNNMKVTISFAETIAAKKRAEKDKLKKLSAKIDFHVKNYRQKIKSKSNDEKQMRTKFLSSVQQDIAELFERSSELYYDFMNHFIDTDISDLGNPVDYLNGGLLEMQVSMDDFRQYLLRFQNSRFMR